MFPRDEYARAITSARARAAECGVRNAPTPAQIALLCQTAWPWSPLLSVGLPALVKGCRDFPEWKLRFGAPPPPGTPTSARV